MRQMPRSQSALSQNSAATASLHQPDAAWLVFDIVILIDYLLIAGTAMP